jgi:hypothetical protein
MYIVFFKPDPFPFIVISIVILLPRDYDMEVRKQGSIMQVAVAGIVVAAIILIAGAFWVGKSASEDTEKAVRNMSLLYLNELAERREQVVAARLADYISDLDVAVGLIGNENLKSIETLQYTIVV